MENKTAKHTPGPWTAEESRSAHFGDVAWRITASAIDGGIVAGMGPVKMTDREGAESMAADARLIAAAPELLEECKKNLWWLQHVRSQIQGPKNVMLGFDQAIKYLGIVIAKAEGR